MRIITLLLLTLTSIQWSMAQSHLEVLGKAQIIDMPKDNTADSVVVRLADGTLGVRDVSTLTGGSSSPWYLGKDTLNGIVYYIYRGSDGMDHGLIVAKMESTFAWQNEASLVQANRSWDGVYNMSLMNQALSAGGLTLLSYALYWSSTENGATAAWAFVFIDGYAINLSKTNTFRVRAIRAF